MGAVLPRAKMLALDQIFPEGIHLPDYFCGKNIVHLPTSNVTSTPNTTGAMKNAFGGLLGHHRHYTHTWIHETLVRPAGDSERDSSGHLRLHGRDHRRQRPGAAHRAPEVKNMILA